MSTPTIAANAYASLARMTDAAGGIGKAAGDSAAGPSFGAFLKDAVGILPNVSLVGRHFSHGFQHTPDAPRALATRPCIFHAQ